MVYGIFASYKEFYCSAKGFCQLNGNLCVWKDAEQIGFDGGVGSDTEEDDDGFAEAEKKITKLKKLLDNGLISQEDFNEKKAEILSAL